VKEMRKITLYKLKTFVIRIVSNCFYNISGANVRNKHKLEMLKDKYKGQRCFMICNGPSLRPEDLTKIYNSGDVSFGFNAIAKIYDKTPWRPTFLSAADDIVFKRMHRQMVKECETTYKIYDKTRFIRTIGATGEKLYLSFDERMELLDKPEFSSNAYKKLPSIGTSVYSIIEFAVFLGFSEIYLLGCDMSYAVNLNRDGTIYYNDSGQNHFYAKEEDAQVVSDVKPTNTWMIKVAYDYISVIQDTYGLKVYNATRGGKLESFTRVSFDELFDKG